MDIGDTDSFSCLGTSISVLLFAIGVIFFFRKCRGEREARFPVGRKRRRLPEKENRSPAQALDIEGGMAILIPKTRMSRTLNLSKRSG